MKLQEPMKTVKALVGDNVIKNERCCGESGTLGVTRPDISTQVRFRKEEELKRGEAALRAVANLRPCRERQDPDLLPELPAGPEALSKTTCRAACSRPTTSSSRWLASCSVRTGWATSWRAPMPAASSGCWCSQA